MTVKPMLLLAVAAVGIDKVGMACTYPPFIEG